MESTSRLQPSLCSCYKLGTECIEFRKIAESQDRGLAIYQYVPGTNDKWLSETSEAFILSSNKNVITREDITTVFEHSKMTCPRCIKIVKHAESLVTNVQLGEVQDVLGVCDHCRLKERLRATSSCKCKEVVKKFITNAKEKREAQRNRVKRWLTQVQHLLKNASIGDSKGYKLKKRARSELSFDKLFSDLNRSEPKYYKEESRAGEKLETSAQLPNTARTSSFSEKVEDVYTDAKAYLNRVTKSVKHKGDTSEPSFIDFPQDKQIDDKSKPGFSKSEDRQSAVSKLGENKIEHKKFTSFLERSEEYFEPIPKPKHRMLSILKIRGNEQFKKQEKNKMFRKPSLKDNRSKAFSEQDISTLGKKHEFTSKSQTSLEGTLVPSLERQSLLPEMPWTKSSSEQGLSRNFSFLFPKEKIEIIERHTSRISSAEIIKDLQDTLKRKAEEEQRKKEEDLKRKNEEKERKKLEIEEKNRIEAERKILADEQKKRFTEKTTRTTEKAEKKPQKMSKDQIIIEEKGQERGEKQEKLQKLKLGEQQGLQEGKADKIQKQTFEGQDKLKKEKDASKQDKEEIQAEKAKIAEAKLAEKEAQKALKGQQKKEKEERAQKAESEKIKAQQKLNQDKAEKLKQKLEEKESLKKEKEKDDRLQKDGDETAKTDSDRKETAQKDEITKKDKVSQKDETTKKDHVTQKDETAKKDNMAQKDESTKKDNVIQKDETAKKGEATKKDETVKESDGDKKGEEDKQTQRAANDELKALLALQEKDKAEREKLKRQQEIEKELAEKKAMEAEKMAKEAKNAIKHDKKKDVKDKPVKSEEQPPKQPESPPPPKDLALKDVKVRKQSGDDLILRLVKLKQNEPRHRDSYRFSRMHLPDIVIKTHARHKCKDPMCPVCRNSELGLDYDECLIAAADTYKPEEITDIIIGEKIFKNTTPYRKPQEKEKEKETMVEFIDETEFTVTVKKEDEVMQESLKETVPTKPLKGKNDLVSDSDVTYE